MINSSDNAGGRMPIEFDPKKIKYNSGGIPVLSAREIEGVASELLQKYCPGVLCKPSMTPVVEIIDRLGERTGLLFAMEDLGFKGTAKVLGKVSFHKKTMYLDISLQGERAAAFRFTAAHEIGHWGFASLQLQKLEVSIAKRIKRRFARRRQHVVSIGKPNA